MCYSSRRVASRRKASVWRGLAPYPGYDVVTGPRGAFGEFRKARLRRSSIAEIVVFVRLDDAAKTGADVPELRNSGRAASWSEVLGRR
jgi:hypothetical protein